MGPLPETDGSQQQEQPELLLLLFLEQPQEQLEVLLLLPQQEQELEQEQPMGSSSLSYSVGTFPPIAFYVPAGAAVRTGVKVLLYKFRRPWYNTIRLQL